MPKATLELGNLALSLDLISANDSMNAEADKLDGLKTDP